MKKRVTARLSQSLYEDMQREARLRNMTATAIVLEAMSPYLDGDARLHADEKMDKETSFLCYTEDLTKLKALAAEANMSWDAALRQILTNREQ